MQHTISSIKKKKYSKNYFVNFKDKSRDSVVLSLDIIMKFALNKNKKVDDETIDEAESEQNLLDCKQAAYNYVSYKPRSEFEVRRKLEDKEYSNENINTAIDFLYDFQLLDDEEYTHNYIKSYLKQKPAGEFKLKTELLKRGIDENLAEDAVSKHFQEIDSYELAMKAAKEKLRKISYKPEKKQKKSLSDFLARRGFNWGVIKRIRKELF